MFGGKGGSKSTTRREEEEERTGESDRFARRLLVTARSDFSAVKSKAKKRVLTSST